MDELRKRVADFIRAEINWRPIASRMTAEQFEALVDMNMETLGRIFSTFREENGRYPNIVDMERLRAADRPIVPTPGRRKY
jgi:hypothetical protein